jgi:integrase
MRTSDVSLSDLTLESSDTPEQAYFTSERANQIIQEAAQPYKTIFALSTVMGARAGELLALTISDLDFREKTNRVNKSADDLTRVVRTPKTKKWTALLPMPFLRFANLGGGKPQTGLVSGLGIDDANP